MSKYRKFIFIAIGLLLLAALVAPLVAAPTANASQSPMTGNLIWSGGKVC